ncbi:MAG: hypothetical protein GY925_26020 [Actinomycetia bacterium]|nr:hypothetical protein [Actinomycetes bacterium]
MSADPQSPDELAYLSLILQEIADASESPVSIEGYFDHPILKVSLSRGGQS